MTVLFDDPAFFSSGLGGTGKSGKYYCKTQAGRQSGQLATTLLNRALSSFSLEKHRGFQESAGLILAP